MVAWCLQLAALEVQAGRALKPPLACPPHDDRAAESERANRGDVTAVVGKVIPGVRERPGGRAAGEALRAANHRRGGRGRHQIATVLRPLARICSPGSDL